jgi:hypothetical protein
MSINSRNWQIISENPFKGIARSEGAFAYVEPFGTNPISFGAKVTFATGQCVYVKPDPDMTLVRQAVDHLLASGGEIPSIE